MSEKKGEDHVIMLTNVRIAFPELFEAKAMKEGDKKAFSASFLMPPDHPDIPKIKAAIAASATAKWPTSVGEILPVLVASDKVCLHNGDAKAQYDGFKGMLFVTARGYTRPLVIGADRAPLTEADGKIYSGCFVNAQVSIWAMQNNWGKRVNAQLRGVQFFKDGEAFGGGGVAAPDEFEEVVADADGAAPTVAVGGADDYSSLIS